MESLPVGVCPGRRRTEGGGTSVGHNGPERVKGGPGVGCKEGSGERRVWDWLTLKGDNQQRWRPRGRLGEACPGPAAKG